LHEEVGININILLDHAQDFTGDPLSTNELYGIDIIVSAGGTGFAGLSQPLGPFNMLRKGDTPSMSYPIVRQDKHGDTVLVTNSEQLFRYIGNLIVSFDEKGKIVSWDSRSGPIATTPEAIAAFEAILGTKLEPIPEVRQVFDDLQSTPSIQESFEEVGMTKFALNGTRSEVRSRETNLARLATDSALWGGNRFASVNGLPAIDVALKNGGGLRDDMLGPHITRLSIRAALAFDDRVTILLLTGYQMIATFENAVSRAPDRDGRFPQVAGMALEFDLSKAGMEGFESLDTPSRVKSLIVMHSDGTKDTLISNFAAQGDLMRTFVVATNSFMVTGADGYTALNSAAILGETKIGEQQILEDYIIDELEGAVSLVDPPPNPRVSASISTDIGIETKSSTRVLQIIHSSDNESSLQDPNTKEEKVIHYSTLTLALADLAERQGMASLHVTAGDHTVPGPFYRAAAEVQSLGANGLGDIAIFNALGLDANGIGTSSVAVVEIMSATGILQIFLYLSLPFRQP
jgi:2',3'-cyclic-nucleotide 2'-phosphodiesterase (5'-nucleotidase family)